MKPDEVLRAAAKLIETGGWSQGEPARDAEGRPVPLFATGSSETGRAAPNPAARQFSVYGAVANVMYRAGSHPSIWGILAKRATDRDGVPYGGDNHVHPVIQFNETEGRTAAEVIAFLGVCADEMQGYQPAAPVLPAPDPQFAEPLPADMVARVVREPAQLREEFPAEPDPAGVRSALDKVGPNPFGGA